MDPANLMALGIVFIWFIIVISIWDGIWKAIALWKAARHDQLGWFICIVIFNTAGILPIIYLAFFQKKQIVEKPTIVKKQTKKKKN